MNKSHLQLGQAAIGLIAVTSLITGAITWMGGYLLNSPRDSATALAATNERVSSLEADNKTLKEWLTRVEGKLDQVIKNR